MRLPKFPLPKSGCPDEVPKGEKRLKGKKQLWQPSCRNWGRKLEGKKKRNCDSQVVENEKKKKNLICGNGIAENGRGKKIIVAMELPKIGGERESENSQVKKNILQHRFLF